MFTSAIKLMELPGKKQKYQHYLDSLIAGIERYRDTARSPAGYQAYPAFLEKVDRYYDDNGFAGIDYLQAYELNHKPEYLSRAKDAFGFIMLEASVMLYQFTKQKDYLSEARQIASSSLAFFGKKNKDGRISVLGLPWFVLILFRGYESLYKVDSNPRYINVVIENVDYAWKQSKDNFGLMNNTWNKLFSSGMTSPKWLLGEACMVEFYARIALLQ